MSVRLETTKQSTVVIYVNPTTWLTSSLLLDPFSPGITYHFGEEGPFLASPVNMPGSEATLLANQLAEVEGMKYLQIAASGEHSYLRLDLQFSEINEDTATVAVSKIQKILDDLDTTMTSDTPPRHAEDERNAASVNQLGQYESWFCVARPCPDCGKITVFGWSIFKNGQHNHTIYVCTACPWEGWVVPRHDHN